MTFEQFCDDRKILYYRQPFFNYLEAIGFKGETLAEFEAEWDTYLSQVVNSLLGRS